MFEVSGLTRLLYVLADPVAHVRGPTFLNAHFREHGFDVVAVPLHVVPADLGRVVAAIKTVRNVAGFGVTIPHKIAVIPFLDEITARARIIEAVNFVKRTADGRLIGDNLDAAGFISGLHQRGFSARGRRVLQLGAGGAGRATAFALAEDGASELVVSNRDLAKAEALAAQLSRAFPAMSTRAGAEPVENFQLVVNSTSLGLGAEDDLPIDVSRLCASTVVYDIVANPPVTALMAAAAARGAATIGGSAMLAAQMDLVSNFVLGNDAQHG